MTDGWAAAAWGAHVQLGAALLEPRVRGYLRSPCTAEGPGHAPGCGVGGTGLPRYGHPASSPRVVCIFMF